MEKRNHPRTMVHLPVDYYSDSEPAVLFNTTCDVSRSGAYIFTKVPLEPETDVEMIFSLYGNNPEVVAKRLAVKGQVIQDRPKENTNKNENEGMGVRFLDLTDDGWSMIQQTIVLNGHSTPLPRNDIGNEQLEEIDRYSGQLKKEAAHFVDALSKTKK